MISKAIEGSIKNISLKTLIFHQGYYNWDDYEVIIRNDGPTMLCLLFKLTNLATRNGVFNLKDVIEKAIQANFENNVKDLLDDMPSN